MQSAVKLLEKNVRLYLSACSIYDNMGDTAYAIPVSGIYETPKNQGNIYM